MNRIFQIIKNTHRHPINQALHSIGAPFYGIGLAMIFGHFAGMQSNPVAGSAIFLVAVTMFVLGHKIEGNLNSMAPVLLSRWVTVLLRRRIWLVTNYFEGNNRKIRL